MNPFRTNAKPKSEPEPKPKGKLLRMAKWIHGDIQLEWTEGHDRLDLSVPVPGYRAAVQFSAEAAREFAAALSLAADEVSPKRTDDR